MHKVSDGLVKMKAIFLVIIALNSEFQSQMPNSAVCISFGSCYFHAKYHKTELPSAIEYCTPIAIQKTVFRIFLWFRFIIYRVPNLICLHLFPFFPFSVYFIFI